MSETPKQLSESLDVDTLEQIDQRCLTFEEERKRGTSKLQSYLRGFRGDARRVLLYELLILDLTYADNFQSDSVLDPLYAAFPDDVDFIELAIEEAQQQIRQQSTKPATPPRSVEDEPSVPTQLGRYKIISQIGQGGMGRVYRALDTRLDREVALKIPRVPRQGGDEHLKRFKREAVSAARVQHSGLCPVLDVDRKEGILFLTSAFIDGQSLQQILDKGNPAPTQWSVNLVATVARALSVAHKAGVVHRDIKPSNIMVTIDGQPVVIDFGLAKSAKDAESFETIVGSPIGTLNYMPPEQVQGMIARPDPRSDVYSLGVVLYQLLSSHLPFEGKPRELFTKILEEAPGPPSRHRSRIPAQLDAICLRAIAKAPEDRFSSMGEFAEELERLAGEIETQQSTGNEDPAPRRSVSLTKWMSLGLSAVMLIAAGTIWFVDRLATQDAGEVAEAADRGSDDGGKLDRPDGTFDPGRKTKSQTGTPSNPTGGTPGGRSENEAKKLENVVVELVDEDLASDLKGITSEVVFSLSPANQSDRPSDHPGPQPAENLQLTRVDRELAEAVLKLNGKVLVVTGSQRAKVIGVSFRGTSASTDDLTRLASCPTVEWLDLTDTSIGDQILGQPAILKQLTVIRLSEKQLTPEALDQLRESYPELTVFFEIPLDAPQPPIAQPQVPAEVEQTPEVAALRLVPVDAVGISLIRGSKSFSDNVDWLVEKFGQPPFQYFATALDKSNLREGWNTEGDLLWVFTNRTSSRTLGKLVFIPTDDFTKVCKSLNAKEDPDNPGIWKFTIEGENKGRQLGLVGKNLPGTGYSVHAFIQDRQLLLNYRPPVVGMVFSQATAEWLKSQDACLLLGVDVLRSMTPQTLSDLIPLVDQESQQFISWTRIVSDGIRSTVEAMQGAKLVHWGIGVRVDRAVGVTGSTHASLLENEVLASLPQPVGNERDQLLVGIPDDPWLAVIGGPIARLIKVATDQLPPTDDLLDSELKRAILSFLSYTDSLTLGVKASTVGDGTESLGIAMIMRSKDSKELHNSLDRLLKEVALTLSSSDLIAEQDSIRLTKKLQGASAVSRLSVESSNEPLQGILGSRQRDLFLQTISPTLLAAVLDSREQLQRVIDATKSGGLSSNPQVMSSVRMVPPTSQWMLLLQPAAAQLIPGINPGMEFGANPLIAAVEVRPDYFEFTVGIPVSVIDAIGDTVRKALEPSDF